MNHARLSGTPPLSATLWIIVVVAITINLRPFFTSVGPLGNAIAQTTGMDLRTLSWLTLLPMALMGLGAWLAPTAAQRPSLRS